MSLPKYFWVYLFTLYVILYILYNWNKLQYSIIFLSLCIIILVLNAIQPYNYKESFSENLILKEETIDDINTSLIFYTTGYNSKSYNPSLKSKNWNDISNNKNQSLLFDVQPIFTQKSGFYLGNNRLVGPHSSDLGIDMNNEYTLMITCKHGNLVSNTNNSDIECIKLYANSSNNNGLSLVIPRDSLTNINGIQYGNLIFNYSDKFSQKCVINKNDTQIHFEKDILSFYFIIKHNDKIRILYMTEKNNTINEILSHDIENDDVTFSNKSLIINRLQSWNSNIYNFAIFNNSLVGDSVNLIYNHIINHSYKYTDPNYNDVVEKYNKNLSAMQKLLNCPYDKSTCDKCKEITNWNNIHSIINSSIDCRQSINDYCSRNPIHESCKCWNTTNATYNNENCNLLRAIFQGKNNLWATLSPNDLHNIMKKYNLLYKNDCNKEKEIEKNKFIGQHKSEELMHSEVVAQQIPIYVKPKISKIQEVISPIAEKNDSYLDKILKKIINPFV